MKHPFDRLQGSFPAGKRPGTSPGMKCAALLMTLAMALSLLPAPVLAATSATGTASDSYCPESRSGSHSWGDWIIRQAPSCTQTGTRVRFCSICGYDQAQSIARTDHSYGAWTVTQSATCTRTGTRVRTCTVCGYTDTGTIARTDHTYGAWKVTRSATCTRTGSRERTCQVCGYKDTETLKKKDHSWGEWTVTKETTPFSAGERSRTCSVCGTSRTEEFDPEGTLRRGDKGSAVKELQQALNDHDFNCGKADGDFGKKTKAAVEAFEKSRGLTVDGVAWPGVLDLLGIGRPATEVPLIPPVSPIPPTEVPLTAPVTLTPETEVPLIPPVTVPPTEEPSYAWAPPAMIGEIAVEKCLSNYPLNGWFFTEGETIVFDITVSNPGAWPLYSVEVTDPLAPDGQLAVLAGLAPSESVTLSLSHTVTALDVAIGCVSNVASALALDEIGNVVTAISDVVNVPTSELAPLVEKVEISSPANGSYYVEGEVIVYEIRISNPWLVTFASPELYDDLYSETHPLSQWEYLDPGETLSISFSYTVTAQDVSVGLVINNAWVLCQRGVPRRDALPVISPAGKPPAPRPSAKKDTCVLTLTGIGDHERTYTLDYCAEHSPVEERVNVLVNAAKDDEQKLAAWQQAVSLWSTEVNELYDRLLSEASQAEKTLIEKDRSGFYTYLTTLQKLLEAENPQDPALTAQLIADRLMDRCTELCYESNTAPGSRKDALENQVAALHTVGSAAQDDCCGRSVIQTRTGLAYTELLDKPHGAAEAAEQALSGDAGEAEWKKAAQLWLSELDALTNKRYIAADPAARPAIAAERNAFGQWLEAREGFLRLIYPGQPATVQEVIAETIRTRVIDLCGEE